MCTKDSRGSLKIHIPAPLPSQWLLPNVPFISRFWVGQTINLNMLNMFCYVPWKAHVDIFSSQIS